MARLSHDNTTHAVDYASAAEKSDALQVELATRQLNEADIELLSKEAIRFRSKATLRLILVLVVQGFAIASFGVDYGVLSGIVATPQFRTYFGVERSGGHYGIIVAAVYIGNFVASAFLWLADYIGRRGLSAIGCAITVLGAVIQVARPNATSLLVGRLFTGGGGALVATVAPMYMNELAPSCWRGWMVGTVASCTYIGTISIGLVNLGSSYFHGDWVWRLPLLFQVVNPLIALFLIYPLTPETPRFLVSRGKVDEARRVIAEYQTTSGNQHSELVEATIKNIQDSLALIPSKPYDFSVLYKKKSDRTRTMIIFWYSMFQQWYGGALFTYYLPAVLSLVGINGTRHQLGLNLGYSATSTVAAFFGSYIFDRMRRRTLLIGGMAVFAVLLTLMTICSALFENTKRASIGYVIVLWVYLFAVVKGTLVIPMHNVYPAETLHFSQRAKGMGAYSLFQAIFGIAITYGASAAIAIIGWKLYIFFICFNIFICGVTYFTFPEYKGLSLELIDIIFETPNVNPVKLSLQMQTAKKARREEEQSQA